MTPPTEAEHEAAQRLAALTAQRLNATGAHHEVCRIKDAIITALPSGRSVQSVSDGWRRCTACTLRQACPAHEKEAAAYFANVDELEGGDIEDALRDEQPGESLPDTILGPGGARYHREDLVERLIAGCREREVNAVLLAAELLPTEGNTMTTCNACGAAVLPDARQKHLEWHRMEADLLLGLPLTKEASATLHAAKRDVTPAESKGVS